MSEGVTTSLCREAPSQSGASSETWAFDSFSQIVFVLKGSITLTLPEEGRRAIAAREWFALSLKNWSAQARFNEPTDFVVINCDEETWKSLSTPLDALNHTKKACFACSQRTDMVFFQNPNQPQMTRLASELPLLNAETAAGQLLVQAKTLELLALVLEHPSLHKSPQPEPCLRNEDQDALAAAAAYLESNLEGDHSLAKISRETGLNEFKLKKGFKERFNTTVFGYLRQKRMEYARDLLAAKTCNVLQASQSVGYSNPSHFTRAFRETFGINPKEFASR
ncbi:MAG: AraC family transcriptional regulator [Verrucomicrobiota bacterium]